MKMLIYSITAIIILYAMGCTYLYFWQDHIIYKPDQNMSSPSSYGLTSMQEIKIKSKDGTICTAWYRPAENNQPTILYFHGNKGNLGGRVEKFHKFIDNGFGLLALSYRGYGTSQGVPSEQGLYMDARSSIDYLVSKNINLNNILLYGESLGSGVAIQINNEYKTRALILEAPYTSIVQLGYDRYPIFPIAFMIRDHFDSIDKITKIKSPVLFFHGDQDKTIPIKYSKILYEKASEPKKYITYPGKGHTDMDANQLALEIGKFIEKQPSK